MTCHQRVLAVVVAGLVAATSACTPVGDGETVAIEPAPSGSAPVFTGPHAEDFTRLWAASKSDLERAIISDEQITEQEYDQLLSWYSRCMADQGLTVTFEEDDVSFGTDDDGKIMAAEGVCLTDTMGMYRELRVNPDNLDYGMIIPACLVRNGVVEEGFGAEDYDRMWQDFPDWWAELVLTDEYQACNDDPLDLLGDQGTAGS